MGNSFNSTEGADNGWRMEQRGELKGFVWRRSAPEKEWLRRGLLAIGVAVGFAAGMVPICGQEVVAPKSGKDGTKRLVVADKEEPLLPSVTGAGPLAMEGAGTLKVLWRKEGKPRYSLDGVEFEADALKEKMNAFAKPGKGKPALLVGFDKRIGAVELEALAVGAKSVGVKTLLIQTAAVGGEGQRKELTGEKVGVTWRFYETEPSATPIVPLSLDLMPSGAVELNGQPHGKPEDKKLEKLRASLKEAHELGAAGGSVDPIVVRVSRESTVERFLEVLAVPAALGFPIDPLTREWAEQLPEQNKEKPAGR
jgi:hypothetical protein